MTGMNASVRNSLLAVMLLFWLSGSALAQPQDAAASAEEARAEEDASQAEGQEEENQDSGDQDDAARNTEQAPESAEQTEGEESPVRFIPSEQISQDLGVSFPSDI